MHEVRSMPFRQMNQEDLVKTMFYLQSAPSSEQKIDPEGQEILTSLMHINNRKLCLFFSQVHFSEFFHTQFSCQDPTMTRCTS